MKVVCRSCLFVTKLIQNHLIEIPPFSKSFKGYQISRRILSVNANLTDSQQKEFKTHLELTKDSTRDKIMTEAVVKKVTEISPTVKLFKLAVDPTNFSFKPGQWVDMFIPGINTVGGFSFASAPYLLERERSFLLAVKYSKHPPAHWLSTQCKEGSVVSVRVGGDFFYEPHRGDTLLVAGGVGINPLWSMFQQHAHILSEASSNEELGRMHLLFAAHSTQELLFKNEIDALCSRFPDHLYVHYCSPDLTVADNHITGHRLNESDVVEALKRLGREDKNVRSYLCGPPSMIKSMEKALMNCGLSEDCIHYELWS